MNSREKIELELAVACGTGDLSLVKTLLANNKGMLGLNFMSDSPLLVACRRSQLKVVEFLISCGANVNVLSGGETPLQLAISNRNLAIVRALLKAGADPHFAGDDVGFALAFAAGRNCPEIVIELLKNGASLDGPCITGWSAIAYVVLVESDQLCDFVCKTPNWLDIEAWDGMPVVHWLARMGRKEYLNRALLSGVDINGLSAFGSTPLHEACSAGRLEAVLTLLAFGANPNLGVAGNTTPFHKAVSVGEIDCGLAIMNHLGLTVMDKVYGKTLLEWVDHDHDAVEKVQRIMRGFEVKRSLGNVFDSHLISSSPKNQSRQCRTQML